MSDNRNDLPPASSPRFLERVREVLSTYLGARGDPLNRGLIVRDLVDAGMIDLAPGYASGRGSTPIGGVGSAIVAAGGAGAYEPDLSPPPTPTGFAAAAAISNLIVECDAPVYSQGHGHGRSVLHGRSWTTGTLPVFADAQPLTEFTGIVASYGTNPSVTWHLWLTWMSADGVESTTPAGGTNGVVIRTGEDVSFLVAAMTGAGNPFTILAVDTVIDGVTFPAGTYTTQSFIQDAQITNAKIKNLAVDNAKIADLSVAKLTAGAINTGNITSTATTTIGGTEYPSFTLNALTGNATFNNAIVRGTVYATSGEFTGVVHASSGDFTGTVYASAGSIGGSTLDATGMQSAGYSPGVSGWRLDSSGSLELPNGSITTGKIVVGAVTAAQDGATSGYFGYPSSSATYHQYVHSNVITITTTGVPLFIWCHAWFNAGNAGPSTTVIDHFVASVTVDVDASVTTSPGVNSASGDFFCEYVVDSFCQAEGSLAVGFRIALAAGVHTLSIRYHLEPRDSGSSTVAFGTNALVQWGGNITCLENKV